MRQSKVSLLPTRAEWTSVKKTEVQAPLHPEATESAQIIHSGNHKNVKCEHRERNRLGSRAQSSSPPSARTSQPARSRRAVKTMCCDTASPRRQPIPALRHHDGWAAAADRPSALSFCRSRFEWFSVSRPAMRRWPATTSTVRVGKFYSSARL